MDMAVDVAVIKQHLIDPEICIRCNTCDGYPCLVGAKSGAGGGSNRRNDCTVISIGASLGRNSFSGISPDPDAPPAFAKVSIGKPRFPISPHCPA